MPFEFDLSYFMNSSANILGNSNLREPQETAYRKAYNHFKKDAKGTDAIILLPPGVGKTGLMGVLPYNISEGRVLLITPQLIIKDTVLSELNPTNPENFWIKRKVINNPKFLPQVIEYQMSTNSEVLEAANIVILNVHKLQSRLEDSLINKVSYDFFDMVIIDEAHHSVANTWIEALHYFSKAKVIKLTGTPVRPDKKEIYGEMIYRYKLSQAMSNNYIKSLRKFDYIPEEADFIIDGIDKKFSYEEVKDYKDEEWISSSVALSPECSINVVSESIKILDQKRHNSKIPHKIIAVACNINHAELIKSMYESKGCKTTIIHSRLSRDEIKKAKLDIKNNRVNAVVEVAMLGEGFDHKYLSIAAIFRPFRSNLAYEQFVGRILRYIPEAEKTDDNIATLVAHKYLNLDELWENYKKEIEESEIIKSLSEVELFNEPANRNSVSDSRVLEFGQVSESGSATLVEEYYLPTDLIEKHEQEKQEEKRKVNDLMASLDISQDEAERIVQSVSVRNNLIKRPDLYYATRRKDIDSKIREQIVPELLLDFEIPKDGEELKELNIFYNSDYSWIPLKLKKNAAMLAVYFNAYLKSNVGSSREDWTIDDYDIAEEKLDKCVEYIRLKLEDFNLH